MVVVEMKKEEFEEYKKFKRQKRSARIDIRVFPDKKIKWLDFLETSSEYDKITELIEDGVDLLVKGKTEKAYTPLEMRALGSVFPSVKDVNKEVKRILNSSKRDFENLIKLIKKNEIMKDTKFILKIIKMNSLENYLLSTLLKEMT